MTRQTVTIQGAGIDPTGSSSSAAGINALLDRNPGARFVAPTEAQFRLGAPVVVGSMGTILSLGTATLKPDAGVTALSVRASNFVLEDGSIVGSQHASLVGTERGIDVVGTSSTRPIKGLYIARTSISNFGGYGLHMLHVQDFLLDGVQAEDIYYGGIFGLSCLHGYLRRPIVRRVSANGVKNANAYGIAWSSVDESGDLVASPMSDDIITQSPTVTDCTTWHALDTHGGSNIQFLDIDVRRCHFPVAMNPGDGPSGPLVAPRNFVVTGTIDSEAATGAGLRPGLIVAGAFDGIGAVDPAKLATGRIDVTVRGHDAGVVLQATSALFVRVRAERCSPAVQQTRDNYDLDLTVVA